MATSSLNISLPETQRAFVEEKIKKEGYGTISEYVRQLIREEQRKDEQREREIEYLRAEIQKGIDDIRAGRSTRLETAEDYERLAEDIMKRGREEFAKRQNKFDVEKHLQQSVSAEEWVVSLKRWANKNRDLPEISDEALRRENLYEDRI